MTTHKTTSALWTMAQALSTVVEQPKKQSIHFPNIPKDAPYRGWIVENPYSKTPFKFWYAGYLLLDPDTLESRFSQTFVPNSLGGIDVITTSVAQEVTRTLSIVKKLEQKGFSFGVFSFEKLEVKEHFAEWRTHVSKMTTREVQRFDANGQAVAVDDTLFVPTLEKTTPAALLSQDNGLRAAKNNSLIAQQLSASDLPDSEGYFSPDIAPVLDAQGVLADVEVNSEMKAFPIHHDSDLKEAPGIYIKVGGQSGIPSFSMLEMYMVTAAGERKVLCRNWCTKMTYATYSKKVRSRKKGGLMGGRSVKIIIKALNETLAECGSLGFSMEPVTTSTMRNVQINH